MGYLDPSYGSLRRDPLDKYGVSRRGYLDTPSGPPIPELREPSFMDLLKRDKKKAAKIAAQKIWEFYLDEQKEEREDELEIERAEKEKILQENPLLSMLAVGTDVQKAGGVTDTVTPEASKVQATREARRLMADIGVRAEYAAPAMKEQAKRAWRDIKTLASDVVSGAPAGTAAIPAMMDIAQQRSKDVPLESLEGISPGAARQSHNLLMAGLIGSDFIVPGGGGARKVAKLGLKGLTKKYGKSTIQRANLLRMVSEFPVDRTVHEVIGSKALYRKLGLEGQLPHKHIVSGGKIHKGLVKEWDKLPDELRDFVVQRGLSKKETGLRAKYKKFVDQRTRGGIREVPDLMSYGQWKRAREFKAPGGMDVYDVSPPPVKGVRKVPQWFMKQLLQPDEWRGPLKKIGGRLSLLSYKMMEFGNPASVGRPAVTREVGEFFRGVASRRHRAQEMRGDMEKAIKVVAKAVDETPDKVARIMSDAADDPDTYETLAKDIRYKPMLEQIDADRIQMDELRTFGVQNNLLGIDQFIDSYFPRVIKGDPVERTKLLKLWDDFDPMNKSRTRIKGLTGKPGHAMRRKLETRQDLIDFIDVAKAESPGMFDSIHLEDDYAESVTQYYLAMGEAAERSRLRNMLNIMTIPDGKGGRPVLHIGKFPPWLVDEEAKIGSKGAKEWLPGLTMKQARKGTATRELYKKLDSTSAERLMRVFSVDLSEADEGAGIIQKTVYDWAQQDVWIDKASWQSLKPVLESRKMSEGFQKLAQFLNVSKRAKMLNIAIHGIHQLNNMMTGPGGVRMQDPLIQGVIASSGHPGAALGTIGAAYQRGVRETFFGQGKNILKAAKRNDALPKELVEEFGLDRPMRYVKTGIAQEGIPNWGKATRDVTYRDLVQDMERHGANLGSWDELMRDVFDIDRHRKNIWKTDNNFMKKGWSYAWDKHDKLLWEDIVQPVATDLYVKYYRIYRGKGMGITEAKRMAGSTVTQLSGFVTPESMGRMNSMFGRFWYFARDWTYSNKRIARGALYGTYGHNPQFDAAARKLMSDQDLAIMARGMYYQFAVPNMVNWIVSKRMLGEGRFTWENPGYEKHEGANQMKALIWVDPDGNEYYASGLPGMHFIRDIINRGSGPLINLNPATMKGYAGTKGALGIMGDKMGPLWQSGMNLIGGVESWPYPRKLEGPERVGKALMQFAPWPQMFTDVVQKPLPVAIAGLLGGGVSMKSNRRRKRKDRDGKTIRPVLKGSIEDMLSGRSRGNTQAEQWKKYLAE